MGKKVEFLSEKNLFSHLAGISIQKIFKLVEMSDNFLPCSRPPKIRIALNLKFILAPSYSSKLCEMCSFGKSAWLWVPHPKNTLL